MIKYLILILMSVSCYLSYTPTPGLEEYIARYEKLTGDKFTIPVYFLTPNKEWQENRYAGVCYMLDIPYLRYIEINEVSWQAFSDTEREELAFHEFSHCSWKINRLHTEEIYRSFPVSLMYPILLDKHLYSMLRSEYLHELITGDTTLVKRGIDNFLDKRTNYVEQ